MRALRGLCALALFLTVSGAGAACAQEATGRQAKYVFLFIGDGMSSAQRTAADYYNGAILGKKVNGVPVEKLLMNSLPVQALTTTYSSESIITDSAAAGTAIATGQKTKDGVIGMDATRTKKLDSIAELAKRAGRKVGIVTSVPLDHATPASFYAHTPGRGSYYEISTQMVNKDFDYFGGGRLLGYDPQKDKDKADLYALAQKNGFSIVYGRSGLDALQPGTRAIAFADNPSGTALQYALDRNETDATLADFTRGGIRLLSDAPQGFFMMIEGGKIDWACHANDGKAAITDNIALDEAVRAAYEFYEKHPQETLIVVTGDHETGGMAVGFAGTGYRALPERLAAQKQSADRFSEQVGKWREAKTPYAEALPLIKQAFGFTDLKPNEAQRLEKAYEQSMKNKKEREQTDRSYLDYGGYEPLTVTCTQLLNNQAGLGWTSYSHTGVPVVTSAVGAGSALFGGYYDNTDIFQKLKTAMGLQ